MVGEVTQHEIDAFKHINPLIGDDFNRVFNSRFHPPVLGIAIGAILAGVTTAVNSSLVMRSASFLVPIFIDYLRNSNDIIAQ